MSNTTRDRFLSVAQRLFAERGFYGTSIAGIADELGLTKQALLHHFSSKEKLYGEVLKKISDRYMEAINEITHSETDALSQLEAIVVRQFGRPATGNEEARLIMRELLDNQDRAGRAGNWYLKPYLESLRDIAIRIDGSLSKPEAMACIYQLLGAANYISMSEPTLSQMFGKSGFKQMQSAYADQMRLLIRQRFQHLQHK